MLRLRLNYAAKHQNKGLSITFMATVLIADLEIKFNEEFQG
jgi:hypothetical protein